jgi:kynureninase
MESNNSNAFNQARELDREDKLAHFRKEFLIDDTNLIYLDGNSLGRLPLRTIERMKSVVVDEWGKRLIRGWNDRWMNLPEELGKKISKIIGAQPDEVIICDTTSIALFKLVYGALQLQQSRRKIVSDSLNFPSDLYIIQGIMEMLGNGHLLQLIPSQDDIKVCNHDLIAHLDENTALLTLSHVAFKSAFMYNMEWVTRKAHEAGALVLWDLSHAVGAVPVNLNKCNVDLAIGCTYKYLNAGPGSPAFLYIRKDLQEKIRQPVWGWLGADQPFNFDLDYAPAKGIRQQITSSPPILGMQCIETGVDLILEAGMDNLRTKSIRQTTFMTRLIDQWLVPLGFRIGSPANPEERGSHISVRHIEGYRINRALIESQPPAIRVIPDFREPDSIRLGVTPLYTTYMDIYRAILRIQEIVERKIYQDYSEERLFVT